MFNYTSTQIISVANTQAAKAIAFFNTDAVKAGITKIKKTPYSAAVKTKVTFDLATSAPFVANNYYRLELFIRLNDNAQSDYSNSLVFKEKPIYFEFQAPDTAFDATETAALAAAFNADQARYGYPVLKASVDSNTTLVIEGITEFQTIADAYIAKWESATTLDSYKGDFTRMTTPAGAITKGKVAFGSYEWILRNLRLPTMENRRFTSPNELEMPVPGVTYNQYTIYYKKDRGILGGAAVGQVTNSETCHVFYVNTALTTDYCTVLDNLTPNTLVVALSSDTVTMEATAATTTSTTISFSNGIVIPDTLVVGTAALPSTPAVGITVGTLNGNTVITINAENDATSAVAGDYIVTATYINSLDGITYTATTNLTLV